MSEFERRYSTEEQWHDNRARQEGAPTDVYALGTLNSADAWVRTLLGDLAGRTVVDFGCGRGHHALYLANAGAKVYAFDISKASVEVARKGAQEAGLQGQVLIGKMAAERLSYMDSMADLVFGHSILHHTDLALTRREVHRILKPGGRAVFLEPLAHNPLLRAFRRLTPSRRTPMEKPLRFEDVLFFAQPFPFFRHREFYLLALAAFVLVPLRSRKLLQVALDTLGRADDALLARWPGLGKYAWVVVMEMIK
jgi:SAM-dependent methyltransferase